jgi:hypothetical protein
MVPTLCLLTCALVVAQPPNRSEWSLLPQFVRGQELAYSGTFVEEALSPGVQFQRSFKIETTVLVLDTAAQKNEVAVCTVLSLRDKLAQAAGPSSVRLEVLGVTPQGRVSGAANLAAALEGPPTIEWGALVEVPRARVGVQDSWVVGEDGRPPRTWRLAGVEIVNGANCVKLVGVQQSEDWDRPRGDRTAWQRRDTVWLSPQLGIAHRVERVLERRDPLRKEPTHRAVLRYDLDSRLTYTGKLFDDRTHEIRQTRKFWDEAVPLLREPAQHRQQLDALLKRIAAHVGGQPPTPYRKAVAHVQKRIEAARRGQTVLEATVEETPAPAVNVGLGQRVPDAVVTDLITRQSLRLHSLVGRPVLLAFYNPASPTGEQVLRFAQTLCEKYRPGLNVVALAVSDDADLVRKQHTDLRLSFPVLDGMGLHQTFSVDATPRLIVLDAEGHLRGGFTGWGAHTPREVMGELQQWLPR